MKKKINKCKDGTINSLILRIILICIFSFEPVAFLILYYVLRSQSSFDTIIAFILVAGMVGVIVFLTLKKIFRNIRCRHRGEIVKAVVEEYLNDNITIDNKKAYLIKLLVHNNNGDETIYYRSLDTNQEYTINSEIELFKYKDQYLIKDAKKNKKEKIMSIISLIIIFIPILIFACIILPIEIKELKLKYMDSHNKEIRTKFDVINYKIPNDFKLISYRDNKYEFEARDDNHFCAISIYKYDATRNDCRVGFKEEMINNNIWCVEYQKYNGLPNKSYEKTINNKYYYIRFNTYTDNDEFCSINFKKFEESLKVNTK